MFKAALIRTSSKLLELKNKGLLTDYVLIGGFALSRWSFPRATADIDFAIGLGNVSLENLAEVVGGIFRIAKLNDPLLGCVSYEDVENSIPIQLIQFPRSLEAIAFEGKDLINIDAVEIPVIGWQSFVILKLYAGSKNDFSDAKLVLDAIKPNKEELYYLRKTAERLRLKSRLAKLLPIMTPNT